MDTQARPFLNKLRFITAKAMSLRGNCLFYLKLKWKMNLGNIILVLIQISLAAILMNKKFCYKQGLSPKSMRLLKKKNLPEFACQHLKKFRESTKSKKFLCI